jgi:hypothetical protein
VILTVSSLDHSVAAQNRSHANITFCIQDDLRNKLLKSDILVSCVFNSDRELFFLVSCGGVGLSPLGTSATNWPVVPAPDDR